MCSLPCGRVYKRQLVHSRLLVPFNEVDLCIEYRVGGEVVPPKQEQVSTPNKLGSRVGKYNDNFPSRDSALWKREYQCPGPGPTPGTSEPQPNPAQVPARSCSLGWIGVQVVLAKKQGRGLGRHHHVSMPARISASCTECNLPTTFRRYSRPSHIPA